MAARITVVASAVANATSSTPNTVTGKSNFSKPQKVMAISAAWVVQNLRELEEDFAADLEEHPQGATAWEIDMQSAFVRAGEILACLTYLRNEEMNILLDAFRDVQGFDEWLLAAYEKAEKEGKFAFPLQEPLTHYQERVAKSVITRHLIAGGIWSISELVPKIYQRFAEYGERATPHSIVKWLIS